MTVLLWSEGLRAGGSAQPTIEPPIYRYWTDWLRLGRRDINRSVPRLRRSDYMTFGSERPCFAPGREAAIMGAMRCED